MNSREKGKRGERELATYLTERGIECRRGLSQSRGAIEADVVGFDGFHLEVKRQERVEIEKWCKQAEGDAKDDETPLVVWRRNRQPWRVTLDLDAFLALVERVP